MLFEFTILHLFVLHSLLQVRERIEHAVHRAAHSVLHTRVEVIERRERWHLDAWERETAHEATHVGHLHHVVLFLELGFLDLRLVALAVVALDHLADAVVAHFLLAVLATHLVSSTVGVD